MFTLSPERRVEQNGVGFGGYGGFKFVEGPATVGIFLGFFYAGWRTTNRIEQTSKKKNGTRANEGGPVQNLVCTIGSPVCQEITGAEQ